MNKIFFLIFFVTTLSANAQDITPLVYSYNNISQWEKHKDSVKNCMAEILHLSSIPKASSSPIISASRSFNGYSVKNIAIETTPGLFVCGSVYQPENILKKIPVMLVPNGHFSGGRYRSDVQYLCASLARMGAMAISYDMFGWGESRLQVKEEDHYRPVAMLVQLLNTNRILDYVFSLNNIDTNRIGITGASGGGSQSMVNTLLDNRIKLSAPVVMLSADFPGGCACENGLPIRSCMGGVNNAEIAAMAAPRPQLIVSDGNDWTKNVPVKEFPYLQKVYEQYNKKDFVKNVHLQNEGHDLGISKRKAVYNFIASHFKLNLKAITNKNGETDESGATIEEEAALYSFGKKGGQLPKNALKNVRDIEVAVELQPSSLTKYLPAPLQSIEPKGWLLQQLQIMAKGSTGHLDEIYDKLKNDNGWLGGKGDGWEETPYWLDGATPLAYLLNDEKLKTKVLNYINWVIDNQRPSGYFGPIVTEERKGSEKVSVNNCSIGEDWWPKMVMLKVMQQYYSATNDKRVISFMSKYFNYQYQTISKCPIRKWSPWSEARGEENIMMVNWLHDITREKFLPALADSLYHQSFPWTKWFSERDLLIKAAAIQDDKDVMARHGVNVAMALKDPTENYLRTGDNKYLAIQKTAFNDLMTLHGLPMGIFSSDEDLHGNGLEQGVELCAIVETMFSLEKIIEATGDVQYMDALERIAFNALPAQTDDNYELKQYFQIPNQVQVARGAFAFTVTQENGMSNVYGTKSGYTCCYANMHQGWTKFASQLWHYSDNNTIALLTYAPSDFHAKIDGSEFIIHEITDYPFSDKINLKIESDKNIFFSLNLRIPSWCKEGNIMLNGAPLQKAAGGSIINISREWKPNDEIVIQFPMQISVSEWASNSRAIERGPLVYALKMNENWKPGHHEEAGDYESIYSTSDWNYGLLKKEITDLSAISVKQNPMPQNFIWNTRNAPVEISVKAKKIPSWKLDNSGILYQPVCDRSGVFRGKTNDAVGNITFIPYGFTKLRIVAFPVVE